MAFSGKKDKDFKKAQYYVWYLGWQQCSGLRGREYTDPVVQDFIQKRHQEDLQTLTLEVTKKEIRIFQQIEKKKNKTEKVNYPPIPSKDVTFAIQAGAPFNDVVACIYLGYIPDTGSKVHVHVYRCDCSDTATMLVRQMNQLIDMPDHQKRFRKIEADLITEGQIRPPRKTNSVSLTSSGHSTRSSGSSHSDPRDPDLDRDIEKDTELPFGSVTEELKAKLGDNKSGPLLLPPRDYDTICRRHGNIEDVCLTKSLNIDIVGKTGGVWGDSLQKDERGNDTRNHSNRNSSSSVQSPSSDMVSPRFKPDLEEIFRNNVNIANSNGLDPRISGTRSNSSTGSPNSTLARDSMPSPRGSIERHPSHHSSPHGTLNSSGGYVSPRSPQLLASPRNMQRLPSDEGYSSVHDKEFPNAFYYDLQPRDRIPSSPISSSTGSRDRIPSSPMDDRWDQSYHPTDMTQSMPEKLFREYQVREVSKHPKQKRKDKKSKDNRSSNHSRSNSEEIVPIPQPDYDITLRVSNKPNARPSSYNQYK